MTKVVVNGKVAVLVSPGFGAGWSTWATDELRERAMFCPELVHALQRGAAVTELEQIVKTVFGDEYIYTGGLGDLKIEWLPVGTRFYIDEYDGSESVITAADLIDEA